jgi:hypothetical protein
MDIVERLRTRPLYEGCGEESDIPDDAADEIEKLRSTIKKADAILAEKDDHWSERIEGARNALFEGSEETR